MERKNRYAKSSKTSEAKFRQLIRLFSLDLTAFQISSLTGLNRNTANRYLKAAKVRLAEYCEKQSLFGGTVEVDESYFGPKRIRGKRGHGAGIGLYGDRS